MLRMIILFALLAVWVKALIDYDGSFHCDDCQGEDCWYPKSPCDKRK